MIKKGFQETNLDSERMLKGKFSVSKKGMPIVSCACGFKILVVPDLKAMNQAINNHLAEHKKGGDGSGSIEPLEKLLTERIIIRASKIAQEIS